MRVRSTALLGFAGLATLALILPESSPAQGIITTAPTMPSASMPKTPMPTAPMPTGPSHGGYRPHPGFGMVVPGIMLTLPRPSHGRIVEEPFYDEPRRPSRPPQQRTVRRSPSGAPPAGERRLVPDEVVIELANSVRPQQIDALQRRHRLTRLESQTMQLSGTTLYRWRIPDRRSVSAVIRQLEADGVVASAQPNYLYSLQQNGGSGDAAQYELAKLQLPQAHVLARGTDVLVAVIDSGIDTTHPDLAGAVAKSYDTLSSPTTPHKHGTGIAGLIAARGKLMGAAPAAKILAIRAFDPSGPTAEGTTFNILKGLDWAAANGARVINMSFAGPSDPAIRRSLAAARKLNIVLVAAAGNAGAKSPPLFPAADPNVIAVTATDADDRLFEASNRGRHIEVAAPGADLLVAIPDGGYEISSGTSLSAAGVSGIVALMLERNGKLTADAVRSILRATARDLGPKGIDTLFGAGLADAYAAVTADGVPIAAPVPRPRIERASTRAQ